MLFIAFLILFGTVALSWALLSVGASKVARLGCGCQDSEVIMGEVVTGECGECDKYRPPLGWHVDEEL